MVTLESVLCPGQFISVCRDGSMRPADQSGQDTAENAFIPFVAQRRVSDGACLYSDVSIP